MPSRRVTARTLLPRQRALVFLGIFSLLATPVLAQDLYVTSDATVAGGNPIDATYGLVTVGQNIFGIPFGGVHADVVDGANLTVGLDALNASTVNILGGVVDSVIVDSSTLNATGGTVTSFLSAYSNSAVTIGGTATVGNAYVDFTSSLNVNGGTVGYAIVDGTATISGGSFTDTFDTVEATNNGTVTISGGNFASGFRVFDNGTITVTGSGLNAASTGPVGYYDPNTTLNYVASSFSLTGTLSSGDAINATVYLSGGVTGGATSLTFSGVSNAALAGDLYKTDSGAVTGIYNDVYIGTSQDGSVQTSPTVTVGEGADTARLTVLNSSDVEVTTNVHDTLYALDASTVRIKSGADVNALTAYSNSTIVMDGGNVNQLQASDLTQVQISGGSVGFLGAGGLSTATINGGTIDTLNAMENSKVTVNNGDIHQIITQDAAALTLNSGNITDVLGYGSTINMYGGIYSGTLYNLQNAFGQAAVFQLFGSGFQFDPNGQAGVYDDGTTTWSGVYWSLTGTLLNGDPLSVLYFEAGAELGNGPNEVIGNGLLVLGGVSAPEPGTVALILVGGTPLVGVALRRRRK